MHGVLFLFRGKISNMYESYLDPMAGAKEEGIDMAEADAVDGTKALDATVFYIADWVVSGYFNSFCRWQNYDRRSCIDLG